MEKKFRKSLFLFRRDLRLEDNTGLVFALQSSDVVIPAFIFTPEQIEDNPYRSDHCLKFMVGCLEDLANELRKKGGELFLFRGKSAEIVGECLLKLGVEAVFVNRDYTPYSQQRDKELEQVCDAHNVGFYSFDDALLHPPEATVKRDGTPYMIFTPYFRNASKLEVLAPVRNQEVNYFQGSIAFAEGRSILSKILPEDVVQNSLVGGRVEALKILKRLNSFENYEQTRDFPAEESSTSLSPYLKFTVCSCREVYAAICHNLGVHHALIRSLYWRDFFTSIAFFFPHVFEGCFHSKFDRLEWSNDQHAFERWCKGNTGFPIVDAGMREMNQTGFMHNRVRMIVASFLIKDLHIDWRWGEKYFAQTLVDYDPAVNNGNWQWAASTGTDAQPYFRIFNPWSQQKKFDSNCVYIKKWVPELCELSSKVIHVWYEERHHGMCREYSAPMTDHDRAVRDTLGYYRAIYQSGED